MTFDFLLHFAADSQISLLQLQRGDFTPRCILKLKVLTIRCIGRWEISVKIIDLTSRGMIQRKDFNPRWIMLRKIRLPAA